MYLEKDYKIVYILSPKFPHKLHTVKFVTNYRLNMSDVGTIPVTEYLKFCDARLKI